MKLAALRLLAKNPLAIFLALFGLACVLIIILWAAGAARRGTLAAAPPPTPTLPAADFEAPDIELIAGQDDATESVWLSIPARLEMAGLTWRVQAQRVQPEQPWRPAMSDDVAIWVYGSIANYILYMADNEANRAAISGMAGGADISLIMADGSVYLFDLLAYEQRPISPADIGQQRAGLTIIIPAAPDPIVLQAINEFLDDDMSLAEIAAYEPPPIGPIPAVYLTEAGVTLDGGGLYVLGQIGNDGDQELTIELADISLATGDTQYMMMTISPPLPWRIEPENSLQFQLSFFLPPLDPRLTLAERAFDLTIQPYEPEEIEPDEPEQPADEPEQPADEPEQPADEQPAE